MALRLRLECWANPQAYLKFDVLADGSYGPWMHLYDRPSQEAIGALTPQSVLRTGNPYDMARFVLYGGPFDPNDQKLAAPAREEGKHEAI